MTYTPGYSENVVALMSRRRAGTHAAFILPLLTDDMDILDVGCGPGTITLDLAQCVPGGSVLGIDLSPEQVSMARESALSEGVTNARFEVADAHTWQPPHDSFDLIFSHALFEHLEDPQAVLRNLAPALRHAGIIALRAPDWGGWVLHPETAAIRDAVDTYEAIQRRNGGDPHAGRKLGGWLRAAGFHDVTVSGTYEIYTPTSIATEYLAMQMEREGIPDAPFALREWAKDPDSLFAQTWMEATGRR